MPIKHKYCRECKDEINKHELEDYIIYKYYDDALFEYFDWYLHVSCYIESSDYKREQCNVKKSL